MAAVAEMHATLATQEAPCGRMMGMKTDIDHSCHNSSSSRSQELVVDGQCCSARSPLRYREVMLTSLNHQEKSEAGNCNMASSCCGCGGCSGCTGCGCGCGCNAGCCGCGGLGRFCEMRSFAICQHLPLADIARLRSQFQCVWMLWRRHRGSRSMCCSCTEQLRGRGRSKSSRFRIVSASSNSPTVLTGRLRCFECLGSNVLRNHLGNPEVLKHDALAVMHARHEHVPRGRLQRPERREPEPNPLHLCHLWGFGCRVCHFRCLGAFGVVSRF